MIKINDKAVSPCVSTCQNADFSKVTAHPEFVVAGKTFYDETGQLQTGTLEYYGIENRGEENEMINIPECWLSALEIGAEAINTALCTAGRNKSAFLFYSDAHWNYGSQMSPKLLKYLYEHTGMTKTIFGGDIVNNEASSYDTMKYLWEWRNMLKGLPNHHSVVGNHDDGNETNNLFSEEYVYGYLLAAEETPDVVRGSSGFYYYIDNSAEKTRYIYLDTAYQTGTAAQTAQKEFVTETLKNTPSGWHIVVVSHIWYEPNYDLYDVRPIPISGMSTEAAEIVDIFENYNARNGEFASCDAKVEFCVGGHVHRDYVGVTNSGIPIILVETDSKHTRSEYTYTAGSTTEASVNGIIADYENAVVKVIRIGRGESFDVSLENKEIDEGYFRITYDLHNVTSSESATSVYTGDPFETYLTATSGTLQNVVVTEGGEDITAECYDNGHIYIGFVRGDLVITAVAQEQPIVPDTPTYTNVLETAVDTDGVTIYNGKGWKENTRMSGTSGGFRDSTTSCCTGYIALPAGTITIFFKNITHGTADYGGQFYLFGGTGIAATDSVSYSALKGEFQQYYNPVFNGDNIVQITINNGGGTYTHMVHSAEKIDDTSVITINEPIE